jgi:hypothetical protein
MRLTQSVVRIGADANESNNLSTFEFVICGSSTSEGSRRIPQ